MRWNLSGNTFPPLPVPLQSIDEMILGPNKQLLDEADHDIKNYPDRGQCCLPKLKAEADNIDRGLV